MQTFHSSLHTVPYPTCTQRPWVNTSVQQKEHPDGLVKYILKHFVVQGHEEDGNPTE